MLRKVLTNQYDLIHAHYVFAALVARTQFLYPLVITHHGDEAFYGWQAPLSWISSRLVDKVIVVTEEIRRAIAVKKATVIPCGIDFELFKPIPQEEARKKLGLPLNKRLVLFVGNYYETRKRYDIAERAIKLVRQTYEDVDLVLAYKRPYDEIPIYMNACDVLVLPSDREGSPQVVKEAMACNLPILATVVGDTPEVLAGIEGCYLCERNPEDFAEKMKLVLAKPFRTNGRKLTNRYELQAIARQIIEVYEQVMN